MKILFFVPFHIDAVDINHEFTTRLAHCLSGSDEVRIATSKDKGLADELESFDILHIFGCWSNSACKLAEKAYKKRLPYIITPLGCLQPWEMEKHATALRLGQQRKVTENASAVNVCGKLEAKTFEKLTWNKKVVLIKNPVLTSQTTFDEVAQLFLALYRKVLDSNARVILSQQAQDAVCALLQLGIDEQAFDYQNKEEDLCSKLDKLTSDDWRYIFIYAHDENVEEQIMHALDLLQYQYPQTDVEAIDRFDTESGYAEGPLKDDVLLSRSILLKNKVKETFANRGKEEQKVCLRFLNLHYELNRNAAPLSHFADLYLNMRMTSMDEDMLKDMVKELDLSDFAERLMSVMTDLLGLTEGFMPFKPKEGKSAETLKRRITKFGLYK